MSPELNDIRERFITGEADSGITILELLAYAEKLEKAKFRDWH